MSDFEVERNHPDAPYLRRQITNEVTIPGRIVKASEYRATRVLLLTNVNPLIDTSTIIKDFSVYGVHGLTSYDPLIIRSEDR